MSGSTHNVQFETKKKKQSSLWQRRPQDSLTIPIMSISSQQSVLKDQPWSPVHHICFCLKTMTKQTQTLISTTCRIHFSCQRMQWLHLKHKVRSSHQGGTAVALGEFGWRKWLEETMLTEECKEPKSWFFVNVNCTALKSNDGKST